MYSLIAALACLTTAFIAAIRPRALASDHRLARFLAVLLGACGLAIGLRSGPVLAWAEHQETVTEVELTKHVVICIAVAIIPTYLYPARRWIQQVTVIATPVGVAVLIISYLRHSPWPQADLSTTGMSQPGMAGYWLVLYGYALISTGLYTAAMCRELRRSGMRPTPVALLIGGLSVLTWSIMGLTRWVIALTTGSSALLAHEAGRSIPGSIASTVMTLGVSIPVLVALTRWWRRSTSLSALRAHLVAIAPARGVISAETSVHDSLSVLQDFASTDDEPLQDTAPARLRAIDTASARARQGRAIRREVTWHWAGDREALVAVGALIRRQSPRCERVSRTLSAALQPAIAIPVVTAIGGAVNGSPRAALWAMILPPLMSLPVLLIFFAYRLGAIPTMRITGTPRRVIMAIALLYELALTAVLHTAGAPTGSSP